MPNPESIAKTAEVSGSIIAITCGVCRWIAVNHDFLAGLGIIIGALVAIAGLGVSWYYNQKRLELDLRQKPRRTRN